MERAPLRPVGRCLVIHEGKILLLRNRYPDGEYYGFPGGHQELAETLEENAIRETKEEANLDVELVKPVYLHEFIEERRRHLVTLYFWAKPIGDVTKVSVEFDPDETDEKPQEALWVPIERMKELPMRPSEFIDTILEDYAQGFPGGIKKLPTVRK